MRLSLTDTFAGIEIAVGTDGASNTIHFRLDLNNVVVERSVVNFYTGMLNSAQYYTRSDYMNLITTQSNFPGCTRGSSDSPPAGPNWWCGLAVSNFNAKFNDVLGLFGFACFLSTAAFVMTLMLLGGFSSLYASPRAFQVLAAISIGAAFFSAVGLITFAAANIKTTFCQVFGEIPSRLSCFIPRDFKSHASTLMLVFLSSFPQTLSSLPMSLYSITAVSTHTVIYSFFANAPPPPL